MIVDVHVHAWDAEAHFGQDFHAQARRAKGGAEVNLCARIEDYFSAAPSDSKAVVFGGKAKLSDIWVPDEYVVSAVSQSPDRLIGFLSADLATDSWERDLHDGHERLGLRGVKLMPMYAGFHPHDRRFDSFWEYTQRNGLPVLLHTGTTFVRQALLDCTLPRWLDDVAIRHPEQRLVLAHLGHPYEGECIAVIRKHPHVYADLSALYYRPFQLYHSLMLVQEYGVWNKVLFGTDFPFTTVNGTIEGLRSLNNMVANTSLPLLSKDQIERLINRDALSLLGLDGSR